jgi:hypothetical protein
VGSGEKTHDGLLLADGFIARVACPSITSIRPASLAG